jgi:hypothetical protein
MARALKLVPVEQPRKSPRTPELKDFVDRAIVPAMVKQYLDKIGLAKKDVNDANSGQQDGRTGVRKVRP